MTDANERLAQARRDAGYATPTEAARARGWNEITYRAHENGERGIRPAAAARYAKAFRVSAGWILTGEGRRDQVDQVPIVGLAGASVEGGVAYSETDGELGMADRPTNGSDKTVALEVRGDSLRGIAEDGWLIFYDEVRSPPTEDLIGLPCVVGLEDGRVLVKYLRPTGDPHVFHLLSTNAEPLFDQIVAWAARVIDIRPRHSPRLQLKGARPVA